MNEEIRESIKKRRNINRKKRKCKNPIEKKELENKCQLQKEEVQKMIREAKEKYEMKLTNEVMEDKGNGTVWKNMNKLMGKSTKKGTKVKIYGEGKLMEIDKALDDFFKVWRLIYNTSENKIDEVWEADTLQNLIEKFNEEETEIHRNIKEIVEMDMSKKRLYQ